jgi:hypothetical protein
VRGGGVVCVVMWKGGRILCPVLWVGAAGGMMHVVVQKARLHASCKINVHNHKYSLQEKQVFRKHLTVATVVIKYFKIKQYCSIEGKIINTAKCYFPQKTSYNFK